MEEQEEAAAENGSKYDTSWSSKTNWTIAGGSLVNSITLDSSFSATVDDIVDERDLDHDRNTNNNSTVKSPLVLHPPSPDHTLCEITITFAQKREVRQVYVRSTARVYEIYYASDLQSSNEYLCTVRCGIAARDEEVLCTPSVEEAVAHLKRVDVRLDGKKSRSDSNLSTNEDDWVEVKAVNSPQLDIGNSPLPSISDMEQGESIQDLYEATAEINDSDPCMSITLRMLSRQDKGYIFVDEIYVFGDPVEQCDTESRGGQMENPADSSLMAMFMPMLLQLSKARSAGQIRGDQSFDTKEIQKSQEVDSKTNHSNNVANKTPQGGDSGSANKQEEMQETVGVAATPIHVEMPPQVSDTVCKVDSSCSRIEKALDQLVSRVSRIEDFFLRFEERVLKPVNSINARLQKVEQKLEELSNKPQNSGSRCCTRISAPDFSWHESDDNFYGNNEINAAESDDNFYGNNENNAAESDEKDYTLSIPADDFVDSVNASQSDSSLLVTDFSNVNDKEGSNTLEAASGSSKDKPRLALSVDDALASALTGLLSSASVGQHKYTQALAIRAPDFSVEEDSSSSKKGSAEVECAGATGLPSCLNAVDEIECPNDSLLSSSNTPCLESEAEVEKSVDNHHFEKAAEGVDGQGKHNKEGKDDSLNRGIDSTFAPSGQNVAGTEDAKSFEVCNEINKTSVIECETQNQFSKNQTDGSDDTQEGALLNSKSSTIVEVEPSDKDVLQVLKLSNAPVLDFETPILDVKFISQENSNDKSLFEALLASIPESKIEAPCSEGENDEGSQIAGDNLISVDDSEPSSPASSNLFFVDMNYLSLDETPLYAEGEKLFDYYVSNKKGECAASLI